MLDVEFFLTLLAGLGLGLALNLLLDQRKARSKAAAASAKQGDDRSAVGAQEQWREDRARRLERSREWASKWAQSARELDRKSDPWQARHRFVWRDFHGDSPLERLDTLCFHDDGRWILYRAIVQDPATGSLWDVVMCEGDHTGPNYWMIYPFEGPYDQINLADHRTEAPLQKLQS